MASLALVAPLATGTINANASYHSRTRSNRVARISKSRTYIRHEWKRDNQKYNHYLIGGYMLQHIPDDPYSHTFTDDDNGIYEILSLYNKPSFKKGAKPVKRFEKLIYHHKFNNIRFKAYRGISTNNYGRYYKVISNTNPRIRGWVSARGINISNKATDKYYYKCVKNSLSKYKKSISKNGRNYDISFIDDAIYYDELIQNKGLTNKARRKIVSTTKMYKGKLIIDVKTPQNWDQLLKDSQSSWGDEL